MELHGIGIPGILDLRHPSRQTNPWIPIGYPWHWHPWVDWHSWSPGTILDLRHCLQGGLGQSANPWIPIGYPWHWHPWVDWDSWNPGTIFTLQGRLGSCLQGGLGQPANPCIPLDMHGIGIPG